MAINMQGSWTVRVHARNAEWPQRFVVSGATVGNGTYPGNPAGPTIWVNGPAWTLQIQHDPGTGWQNSDEQFKFPTVSGGLVTVDIESNDAGGDEDFDDLVLRCTTPQTETDFIVYGSVRHYDSRCILNPCWRRPWVIDSAYALAEAVKLRPIRPLIEQFYPERLREKVPPVGPLPDPPFRPLVLGADDPIPPRQALVSRLGAMVHDEGLGEVRALASSRLVDLQPRAATAVKADTVAIAKLLDRYRLFCRTGPLPGVVLRFQEYDRTGAELAGGPYTGDGVREDLGVCATDRNGNYLFRFRRTVAQLFAEGDVDVAAGEDELAQSAPDVIVQVLDPMAPGGVRWESAPYWNIPQLKRINVCVPDFRPVTACQGQNAIQAIGNIFIGAPAAGPPPPGQPTGYGARVGFSNTLNADGRITAQNVLGPQTRCAAWRGVLDLYACFLDQPGVVRYTIRHRKVGESGWKFFQQSYLHPMIAKIGLPGYSGDPVGPFPTSLSVDGGPAQTVPAYVNIENDPAFVFTHRNRKAQIYTWLYEPLAGAVQFWIEGYDAGGNRLVDDSVTLFIDHREPRLSIASVEMDDAMGNPQPGSDCALFTVPGSNPAEPLRIRYRADDLDGQLGGYDLSVRKGNIGNVGLVPIVRPGEMAPEPRDLSDAYVHGDPLLCTLFHGTSDHPYADGDDFVTVEVAPTSGRWLDPGQPFCTFAVNVSCQERVTNGYGSGASYGPAQYLLGIQA